jgi:hypothetical protein
MAFRRIAVAAAIATAMSLSAAPVAAGTRWLDTADHRVSQRIKNRGLISFLWTKISALWDQEGVGTNPGG